LCRLSNDELVKLVGVVPLGTLVQIYDPPAAA
jgi:hypothetical protein